MSALRRPMPERRMRQLPSHRVTNYSPRLVAAAGKVTHVEVFSERAGSGDLHDSNWRNRVGSRAVAGARFVDKNPTPHDLRHARATETLDIHGFLWPDHLDTVADAVEIARRNPLGLDVIAQASFIPPGIGTMGVYAQLADLRMLQIKCARTEFSRM